MLNFDPSPTVTTPPMPANHTSPDWVVEMAQHAALVETASQIAAQQTRLMETLRLARADASATVSVRVVGDQVEVTDGPDIAAEEQALAALDARAAQCRADMQTLARRIMTYVPQTSDEALTMLQFVSRLMRLEHKVDDQYLADVLDDCADAMFACQPANAPAPKLHRAM